MSCSWRDVLALAQRLRTEPGADEVMLRSAMSRAYYAALHRIGGTFPGGVQRPRGTNEGSHLYVGRLAREYAADQRNPGWAEAARIAERFQKAKSARVLADYQLQQKVAPADVNELFRKVDLILRLCETVHTLREGAAKA